MKNSLINLSFDDGRLDNFKTVYPILKRYNLPATFNITTGYVRGDHDMASLAPGKPMTVEMVKELFRDKSMEIAGHGYYHRNTIEDIVQGIEELKKDLDTDQLTECGNGFASPGTGFNLMEYGSIKQNLESAGIKYIRLSLRYLHCQKLKILFRKISRVIKLPLFYRWAYQDTLMDRVDNHLIYSIPVLSSISVNMIIAVIKYAEKHKMACVLMLHSIVEDGCIRDNWDFERSKFEKICKFLADHQSKNKLEVTTSMNIYQKLNH